MLQVHKLRELYLQGAHASVAAPYLSAASGLVQVGTRLYVVADDELSLGEFDLLGDAPGRLHRLFEGELPSKPKARKAVKPDCEALMALPAWSNYPYGALLALGSASRDSRQRGALLALDAAGAIDGAATVVDLAPLLSPLRARLDDLNIEAAFVQGDRFVLLQRGNRGAAINASIEFAWPQVQQWLAGAAAAPAAGAITRFELGLLAGVPLAFTDAAALPDGGWLFSAAAEDTANSYADGACVGSAIGRISPAGAIEYLHVLSLNCKVEGLCVTPNGAALDLLMVTDADDRQLPALLLSAAIAKDPAPHAQA